MIKVEEHVKQKPLKSVSIKLPLEMVDAIKSENVNLSSLVRDLLNQTDIIKHIKSNS